MSSARFFTWIQDAEFYARAHADAVALVPPGPRTWMDVGCGPGLLTRLAALRGFLATGYDRSPDMVHTAERLAARQRVPAAFEVASLEDLVRRAAAADVVSAASLLAVVPDPRAGLDLLWRLVAPGGTLLVVETTAKMQPSETIRRLSSKGALGLLLWGVARRGRSAAVQIDAFSPAGLITTHFHSLLDGLLGAWLFQRATAPSGSSPDPGQEKERAS